MGWQGTDRISLSAVLMGNVAGIGFELGLGLGSRFHDGEEYRKELRVHLDHSPGICKPSHPGIFGLRAGLRAELRAGLRAGLR